MAAVICSYIPTMSNRHQARAASSARVRYGQDSQTPLFRVLCTTKKWRMHILAHVTQPKHVLESCL